MTTDPRRSEMTAAQLFEAALDAMGGLGWARGRWHITLHVDDGRLVRVVSCSMDERPPALKLGRRALDTRSEQAA